MSPANGLEEYGFLYALLIVAGGLAVVVVLLALAWWRRSTVAAPLALVAALLVGWFLQPWPVFKPPMLNHPHQAYWMVRWQLASVVWALVFMATIANWLLIKSNRKRNKM